MIEEPFELNVALFVEAADAVDFIKRAINQMIVRDGFDRFIGKNAAELATLAPPGAFTSLRSTTARLLQFALDRGGEDNITIVLVPFPLVRPAP